MALDKFAFGTLGHSGSLGGRVRKCHFYATDDTPATVETNGYFDPIADQFAPGKGDVLILSHTNGGTNGVRVYSVDRSGSDITLTRGSATAIA